MLELIKGGTRNIVCVQPFGCLPNHICGKGMIRRLTQVHPGINIVPIDYDLSATKVNQENRIKLMLSVARERLGGQNGGSGTPQPVYGDVKVPSVKVPGLAPAFAEN